jgi:hypothetical protein
VSISWFLGCDTCEKFTGIDRLGVICDERGADIWIKHPPQAMDVAELVLFLKAHSGHVIFIADEYDDSCGDRCTREQHISDRLHRKYNKVHGLLCNPDKVDDEGNWTEER